MAIESHLNLVRSTAAAEQAGDTRSTAWGTSNRISVAGDALPAARSGRPGEGGAPQTDEQQRVSEAVTRIEDFVQTVRRELQFQIDRESGQTIVRVVDRETNEVIRQIPPEEILEVSRRLRALTDGLLIKERA